MRRPGANTSPNCRVHRPQNDPRPHRYSIRSVEIKDENSPRSMSTNCRDSGEYRVFHSLFHSRTDHPATDSGHGGPDQREESTPGIISSYISRAYATPTRSTDIAAGQSPQSAAGCGKPRRSMWETDLSTVETRTIRPFLSTICSEAVRAMSHLLASLRCNRWNQTVNSALR